MLNVRPTLLIIQSVVWIIVFTWFPGAVKGQTPNAVPSAAGSAARTAPSAPLPAFVPMTKGERWHKYLSNLVGPSGLIQSAAGAGINQWNDSPSEWKQDAGGYGVRFANSYGIHMVRQTIKFGAGALL